MDVLIEEMEMLEGEVSMKYAEMNHLDEKIKRGFKGLGGVSKRMQRVRRCVSANYYNMKTE